MAFDLANPIITGEAEKVIDPDGGSIGTAFVGNCHTRRPIEQFFRVENIVDPLILPESAGMDPGARRIEMFAHKGVILGNG